ncbi:hypothetical protein EYB53_010600 [Candidatus Chloroploca sp. M-50]|uniref:Uncharacterized protein n=1 Tax=Candidatus Chloroploca mongolica TaxID=2528176 RepID=A0ABS4D9P7_9CHLR|nr:hypothetical protein [Candidatus Chloroploca mongolica]MBP1466154.1 hypothetical protein [Candidatus Chloroploca mongolica]
MRQRHRWWAGLLVVLAVVMLFGTMPAAPVEAQSRIYFPQTGHYLGGAFRSFWERNGGVELFGYPLSEEFIQNRDGRVAQFFERARFELDVVNNTAVVSLGLVGREYLAATGQGFPRLAPVNQPGVRYFPETGHTLRGAFRTFWERRGGLPIFGFPISEELVQELDGRGNYVVQYFERGRFELVGSNVRLSTLGTFLVPCQLRQPLPPNAPPTGPIPEGDPSTCPPPVNLNSRVFPDPTSPGTVQGFEAHGYQPGEDIALWLNLPNGTTRALPYLARANSDGAILIGFLTETRDPVGNWSIVGQGLRSNQVRVATFVLQR